MKTSEKLYRWATRLNTLKWIIIGVAIVGGAAAGSVTGNSVGTAILGAAIGFLAGWLSAWAIGITADFLEGFGILVEEKERNLFRQDLEDETTKATRGSSPLAASDVFTTE